MLRGLSVPVSVSRAHNMSQRTFLLLLLLYVGTEHDTAYALAQRIRVPKSSVTRCMNRLEGYGFTRRVRNHDDKRIVRLKITQKGHNWVKRIEQAMSASTH